MPRIIRPLGVTVILSIMVTVLHGRIFDVKITLTPVPFTLIGLALAIFLGFRNNASYDRFWEGRKLWGELIGRTRALGRMLVSYANGDEPNTKATVYRIIAFVHALHHHLRGTNPASDIAPFLSAEEQAAVMAAHNRPDAIIRLLTADMAALLKEKKVSDITAMALERHVAGMAAVQAGCERLLTTPLPFSYTLMLHRTAYLYCFALPFGLVDSIGIMTPFVVAIVCYTFFALDALGDEIEEPFGMEPNDLPLAALSRIMERDLRAALGETDLPPALKPVDACLM